MALYQHDGPEQTTLHFDPDRADALIARYLRAKDQTPEEAEDILNDVIRSIQPLAANIVRFYAQEREEQEDMAQEVLFHLVRSPTLTQYDRNPDNLKPYLSTVIRRKAIELWRKRMRHQPQADLELREDLIADCDPIDDEPESSELPQIELLNHWLVTRFTSLQPTLLATTAELVVQALGDNLSQKATLRLLREYLDPPLSFNQINVIYQSSLVFLRAISWKDAYIDPPLEQVVEFSLVPELRLILGEDASKLVYSIFRGCSLHFRVKA